MLYNQSRPLTRSEMACVFRFKSKGKADSDLGVGVGVRIFLKQGQGTKGIKGEIK